MGQIHFMVSHLLYSQDTTLLLFSAHWPDSTPLPIFLMQLKRCISLTNSWQAEALAPCWELMGLTLTKLAKMVVIFLPPLRSLYDWITNYCRRSHRRQVRRSVPCHPCRWKKKESTVRASKCQSPFQKLSSMQAGSRPRWLVSENLSVSAFSVTSCMVWGKLYDCINISFLICKVGEIMPFMKYKVSVVYKNILCNKCLG